MEIMEQAETESIYNALLMLFSSTHKCMDTIGEQDWSITAPSRAALSSASAVLIATVLCLCVVQVIGASPQETIAPLCDRDSVPAANDASENASKT